MSQQDALVLVFSRNMFYKRLHYLALATLALVILVIFFLAFVLYYLTKNPPKPLYFATDEVGALITIVPVTQPNMSNNDAIAWVTEAVQNTYSYDFVNFRAQMQSAQKYFTTYGWDNYMKALTVSGNLPALSASKQIVIAQVVPPVKIVAQGILGGAYAYKFQMQVLLTYWSPPFNDSSRFTNPLDVSVIVQRQEILKSYKGLAILQIIAQLVSTPSNNQPQQLSTTPTAT